MATELRPVRHDDRDGVLHVVLARPPANALGAPLVEGLEQALDALEAGSAKAIVLSSAVHGFFAAGADIKQMSSATHDDFVRYRDALRSPLERLAAAGRRWPPSTGSPSASASSWRWPARCASRPARRASACPRSSSG